MRALRQHCLPAHTQGQSSIGLLTRGRAPDFGLAALVALENTCVAIVQCAASVEASSSAGASSGTAVAVVVVSSHSIGSGLRVIARVSTSSMRETGTISSPLLMLSAISKRSL